MWDVYDMWEQRESEKERELQKLPVCSECGEPIQTEICFEFDDELICPDCLNRYHRKWVDDYVG